MTDPELAARDLDERTIAEWLAELRTTVGRPLSVIAVTESTNDDAKKQARAGAPHGSVFVADRQTGGRGRLGRAWYSPAGQNLYVSFVLRPRIARPERLPALALVAGLAVADVVRAVIEPERARPAAGRVQLKWPNDVLVDGRKIAGVLLERQSPSREPPSRSADGVVVGIGLNVRVTGFPDEISGRATSLVLALFGPNDAPGRAAAARIDPLSDLRLHRGWLLSRLCRALEDRLSSFENDSSIGPLREDLAWLDALAGQSVSVDGELGLALGIDETGALRVRAADGRERSLWAGEVTFAPSDQHKLARSPDQG